MRSSFIAWLFFTALCSGQQPDATVDVKGLVTDSLTKAPLLRAHVLLESAGNGETKIYGAMTGADGGFSIKGVASGPYDVSAEKAGYATPSGADGEGILRISPDKNDLHVEMAPDGWITGRVTNADGEPVEGVGLTAESASVNSRFFGTTDAEGRFRIGGIAPARYRVFAAPDIPNTPPEQRTDGTVDVQDALTWFPGSLTRRQGRPVDVIAGLGTSGIDIRLARVPIVSVSGRVENVPPGTIARITMRREDAEAGSSGIVKPDGTFHIWRVMPGKYEIGAAWQLRTGVSLRSPPVEVEISRANVENLSLRPVAPVDLAGHLEFTNDTEKPKADNAQILILTSAGFQVLEYDAPISPDKSFVFDAVPPGRYRVTLAGEEAYVASMQMGAQAIQGSLLDLSAGATGALTVHMSPRTATVRGVVTDAQGPVPAAQVTLVFDGAGEGEGGGVFPREVAAGPNGAYTFDKVTPGRYKLIALGRDDAAISIDDYADLMESIEVHPDDRITRNLTRVDPQ